MFKKCLIFLFILTISYLYPINSKAQQEEKAEPGHFVCWCLCNSYYPIEAFKRTLFTNGNCENYWHVQDSISNKTECENRNGKKCYGNWLNGNLCSREQVEGTLKDCDWWRYR